MNAKHLTVICSACSLLLANYLLLPAWSQYKRLGKESQQAQAALEVMAEHKSIAQKLPARDMHLSDRAVALSSAVNVWTASSRDYGITFTQIASPNLSMGQNVVDVDSLSIQDPLTGLPVQRLTLKGQYRSLMDFKRFVAQEMNPDQAVAIEELKLHGDSFELLVGIYSKGS